MQFSSIELFRRSLPRRLANHVVEFLVDCLGAVPFHRISSQLASSHHQHIHFFKRGVGHLERAAGSERVDCVVADGGDGAAGGAWVAGRASHGR